MAPSRQTRSAGSQLGRNPHESSSAAPGGARQHHVADIGAGDQEDEGHRAEQYQDRALHIADHLLLQRHDADREGLVALVSLADAGGDEIDIGLCLPRRDAGLEVRHDVVILVAAILLSVGGKSERKQEFRLIDAGDRGHDFVIEQEFGPQYADHGELVAVEIDGAADHLRIGAKQAPPKFVGEQGDGLAAGLIVLGHEQASEEGAGAEHLHEAGGGANDLDVLRLRNPDQIHALADGE